MTDPSPMFPGFRPPSSVGTLIRHRRETLGMTRAELAVRLSPDLGERDIAALESGRIILPCWSLLQRLGQALELSNEAFLVGFLAAMSGAGSSSGESVA
jgi:predicted transcriptional regulator